MSTPSGIVCTPLIDVGTLIQPILLRSVFREGAEVPIDQIVDITLQDKITASLLQGVSLPPEFQQLGDVICLQLEMNKIRAVTAMLRGEEVPEFDIGRVFEMVLNLQIINSIATAFGGATT